MKAKCVVCRKAIGIADLDSHGWCAKCFRAFKRASRNLLTYHGRMRWIARRSRLAERRRCVAAVERADHEWAGSETETIVCVALAAIRSGR